MQVEESQDDPSFRIAGVESVTLLNSNVKFSEEKQALVKVILMDPKAMLSRCETLMLDMDGTVLDLAFDNYVWRELVPERYAHTSGKSVEAARDQLFAQYRAIQGHLEWYCLDHWSDRLGMDMLKLHRDVNHRIDYLPGAKEFLQTVRVLPRRSATAWSCCSARPH